MKTVVSKGEFAKRKGRGPSAVSNWIRDGKISAAALIGSGNAAKIWLERAEADLAGSLDPSQQVNQATPILAGTAAGALADLPLVNGDAQSAPVPPPSFRPVVQTDRELDLARRTKADADSAELDLEIKRRKMAVDEGRYVEAAEATRSFGRELAKLSSEIETWLFSTLAREIANAYGLDWKALAVAMRESYRKFRAGISDDARDRREAIEAGKLNVDPGEPGRAGADGGRGGDEAAAAGGPE
ncbi:hypothetical protein ACE10Z_23560 [Bradyrhizobium sp. Pha-3]|uniref:hypothetical protein n=1 Tax=Bradyrhizobium sp. Pha-3 TaxID=208375 RepID=UPI0035D4EC1B